MHSKNKKQKKDLWIQDKSTHDVLNVDTPLISKEFISFSDIPMLVVAHK